MHLSYQLLKCDLDVTGFTETISFLASNVLSKTSLKHSQIYRNIIHKFYFFFQFFFLIFQIFQNVNKVINLKNGYITVIIQIQRFTSELLN